MRALVTGGALALSLALGGCAGDSPPSPDSASPAASPDAPDPATGGDVNGADVEFAQMMIVHHRDALTMAEMATDRTTDAEVLALAARIVTAQQPEIDLMTTWLEEWGEDVPTSSTMAPMEHGSTMPGAMSEEQMTALEGAQGESFDRLFLSLMISHHSGAVTMARDEIDNGANPDAIDLAQEIENAQLQEIEEMRDLLGS
jgi:uncharacterized protein (DUF305 family)